MSHCENNRGAQETRLVSANRARTVDDELTFCVSAAWNGYLQVMLVLES